MITSKDKKHWRGNQRTIVKRTRHYKLFGFTIWTRTLWRESDQERAERRARERAEVAEQNAKRMRQVAEDLGTAGLRGDELQLERLKRIGGRNTIRGH